jgi:hypothetical protein
VRAGRRRGLAEALSAWTMIGAPTVDFESPRAGLCRPSRTAEMRTGVAAGHEQGRTVESVVHRMPLQRLQRGHKGGRTGPCRVRRLLRPRAAQPSTSDGPRLGRGSWRRPRRGRPHLRADDRRADPCLLRRRAVRAVLRPRPARRVLPRPATALRTRGGNRGTRRVGRRPTASSTATRPSVWASCRSS